MNRRQVRLVVVVATCLVVLAHPLYAFPHASQTPYSFGIENTTTTPPPGDGVAYVDLPDSAKSVVDAARNDEFGFSRVYDPSPAKAALEDYDYVRQDDTYYEYRIRGADVIGSFTGLFRNLASGLAGLVLGVSALARKRAERASATPRYGVAAIAGAVVGAYTVHAHDALFTPATLPLWPPHIGVSVVLLTVAVAFWVAVGTLGRRSTSSE